MEQIIGISIMLGSAVIVLVTYLTVRRRGAVFVFNSLSGAATLCIINILSHTTGFALGYSALSLLTSIILGIPGVVGMLFLRVIWGL